MLEKSVQDLFPREEEVTELPVPTKIKAKGKIAVSNHDHHNGQERRCTDRLL